MVKDAFINAVIPSLEGFAMESDDNRHHAPHDRAKAAIEADIASLVAHLQELLDERDLPLQLNHQEQSPDRLTFSGRQDDQLRPASFPQARARLVRGYIRRRRERDQAFGADMFADPAWDMLLDLYAAHYERRRVSVSSLCIAAAVPSTTALRWIATMTEKRWIVRDFDPADRRRVHILLAESARIKLDRWFDALQN
ncbi:winged helix DNA-binding protein [Sphingopyxis terrae]|uniref:winged helix DNA-binding protein n=1 Tax=Sphingopyxis terrae TaxID=33052 RepID=UPI00387DBEE3